MRPVGLSENWQRLAPDGHLSIIAYRLPSPVRYDFALWRRYSPDVYPASRLWNEGDRQQPGMNLMSKILLAEDDVDMRRFLVKALQNAGFDVISYDNGLSAYQRLREEPFELLLTDIVMPEMDGIELARRAAELDPDIKIMFITGFAAVALNADSTAPKNAKVLSKPIHLRELVTEVQKLVGGLNTPPRPTGRDAITASACLSPARWRG